MDPLPQTANAPAIRTDFSNGHSWEVFCAAIHEPSDDGFLASLHLVDDPRYEGLTADQVPSLLPKDWPWSFAFLIDATSMSHREHPVLVVDLSHEPGRTFRVIPSQMWAVENNLSIANMDFADFADAVSDDGIFRGWP